MFKISIKIEKTLIQTVKLVAAKDLRDSTAGFATGPQSFAVIF
jgi:hypothetical protein